MLNPDDCLSPWVNKRQQMINPLACGGDKAYEGDVMKYNGYIQRKTQHSKHNYQLLE